MGMSGVDGSSVTASELAALPLFQGLWRPTLARIAKRVRRVHLRAGEILCRQGEEARSLEIVWRGRLLAFSEQGEEPEPLGEIGRGEVVGEMALVFGGRRTATVAALRDSELLLFTREDFDALFRRQPEVARQLCRVLAMRLADALDPARRTPPAARVVSLFGLTPGVDVEAFSIRLKAELAAFGRTERLRVQDLAPAGAEDRSPHLAPGELEERLDRVEGEADFLLLVAERGPELWSRVCSRRADRVLLLADAQAPTCEDRLPFEPSEENGELVPRLELVLLHPRGMGLPDGTARWTQGARGVPHHHLRRDEARDLRRLARHLAARSRALVLGGGGARGFAHIGVIRALSEAGIEIDRVGGTSMGALIAVLLARGDDHRAMLDACRRVFVDANPANDYTLPVVSLLAGHKATRAFLDTFGESRLEDLWLPAFCVSTNLSRNCLQVDDRGPIWLALRATTAIPGVFPPVVRNGELFVDGGLVDNLPVDIARRWRPKTILAVDLATGPGPRVSPELGPTLDNWAVFRDRFLRRREPRPPTILELLWASSTIASEIASARARRTADLVIRPQLEDVALLDWRPLEEIARRGYEAAMRALDGGCGARRAEGVVDGGGATEAAVVPGA